MIERSEYTTNKYNRMVSCPFCGHDFRDGNIRTGNARVKHLLECPNAPRGRCDGN